MNFFLKGLCGVFELPLLRNAPKRDLKNWGGWGGEERHVRTFFSDCLPDMRRFFFLALLIHHPPPRRKAAAFCFGWPLAPCKEHRKLFLTKVTCICRSQKQRQLLTSFPPVFFTAFLAFCNKGQGEHKNPRGDFFKKPRGAAKKKMTKVTYICCSAKKKVVTYFILFLFLILFFIDLF
jgi:hypothetical protein